MELYGAMAYNKLIKADKVTRSNINPQVNKRCLFGIELYWDNNLLYHFNFIELTLVLSCSAFF